MLATGRILTLENGIEYVIVCSCKYENNDYVYLANLNDDAETKICIYKNDIITEVEDEDTIEIIEKLLLEDLKNN